MQDLRKILKDHGITQAFIARQLGLSRQTVNSVVNGRARSKRVEFFISFMFDLNEEAEIKAAAEGINEEAEEAEEEDDTAEEETQQSLIREEAEAFCRRWKL